MTNIEDQTPAKLKSDSRHLTRVLLLEFSYCIAIFLCFTFFPFLNQKTADWGKAIIEILIYYALLLLVPFCFNIVKIINAKRNSDFLKLNNYIIAEILLIIFVLWIIL